MADGSGPAEVLPPPPDVSELASESDVSDGLSEEDEEEESRRRERDDLLFPDLRRFFPFLRLFDFLVEEDRFFLLHQQ